ncbi:MAG: ATP-binding cassette domain-containing protein [Acidobacteria bacterium]|nr:ATP-binding cassette domain-containing protein [Acidobacteriota bacterium]
MVALVGPSGSGKSSLLRLINRLDEPTGGRVLLDGRDYREIAPRELRRRVGMVMQRPYLFPGTVADNVRFGPAQRGLTVSDAEVDGLLARVDLAGFGARGVDRLSGGEAQRVSIARALANGPEALLLDEPTSALDEGRVEFVERLVGEMVRERGLVCLMVTHDREQARRMADRVLRMADGELVGED